MPGQELALHETLRLHELLLSKSVNTTKTATMVGLVNDPQLKSFMQQEVQSSKQQMRDLQNLLSNAVQ